MGKILASNKKSHFNYHVIDTFEAGISLKGTEVKSIIKSNVEISESFIIEKNNELFIINMYVAPYEQGNINNVETTRNRKLLLHKDEILKINLNVKKNKLTIIPLNIHFNNGKIKLLIATAKHKNAHDKREDIKKRDDQRAMKISI